MIRKVIVLLFLSFNLNATTLITKKQTFEIEDFTTAQGQNIESLRLGYETYGTLNSAKSNAILITHYFSGSSHAAGKYAETDQSSGYWDSIIGAGKAIDTNTYFVISVDTIANLNAFDANVTTTGPASLDPKTKKAYGLQFPVVSVADFVQAQNAIVSALGITKLHAIIGASGGGIQAIQWAADFPEKSDRYIAVIAPGLELPLYSVAELDTWTQPIMLDPAWQNGAYQQQPTLGLSLALRNITLSAVSFEWVDAQFKNNTDYSAAMKNIQSSLPVNDGLLKRGQSRTEFVDANHVLYTARAYQLFDVSRRVKEMKGSFLFIPATTDRIFPPTLSKEAAKILTDAGLNAEVFEIDGKMGHLDGLFHIQKAQEKIKQFLQ